MPETIAISLAVPGQPVAAGGTLNGTLTIQNRGNEVDRLIIQVSGIDPSWYTATPAEVNLFPGDQEQAQIAFHPPKASSTRAGRYIVKVAVRSTARPDQSATGHVELEVLPYYGLTLDLRPRRVTAARAGSFTVVAANQGNAPLTLQFTGQDDEAALDYQFAQPQIAVEPGATQTLALSVAPRANWRGEARSFAFAVSAQARGLQDPVRTTGELVTRAEKKRAWWPILVALLLVLCVCPALAGLIAVGGASLGAWYIPGVPTIQIAAVPTTVTPRAGGGGITPEVPRATDTLTPYKPVAAPTDTSTPVPPEPPTWTSTPAIVDPYNVDLSPFLPGGAQKADAVVYEDLNGDGQLEIIMGTTVSEKGTSYGASYLQLIVYDPYTRAWHQAYQERDDPFYALVQLQPVKLTGAGVQLLWTTLSEGSGGYLNVRVFGWDGAQMTKYLEVTSLPQGRADLKGDQLVTIQAEFQPGDPECCPSACRMVTYAWSGALNAIDQQVVSPCP